MTSPDTGFWRPSPAYCVQVPTTASGGLVEQGGVVLLGWSIKEATGLAAANTFVIDGGSSAGAQIAAVNLNAGESTREWFGPQGIEIRSALFWAVTAGSVSGVFYVGVR